MSLFLNHILFCLVYHFLCIFYLVSLVSLVQLVCVNVRKVAKIRSRYYQVPYLTQDTTWESNKNKHNKTSQTRDKRSALSKQVKPDIPFGLLENNTDFEMNNLTVINHNFTQYFYDKGNLTAFVDFTFRYRDDQINSK